ncbi:MAG: hypothetical protein NVS2B12_14100 [Ktedonobacteraceae bacterium]
MAQRALAQLRASSSRYHHDAQLSTLILELQRRSPEFARWWPRHEVQEQREGQKEFIHPLVGSLILEHNTFQIEDAPGLKMVVYLPACPETASKLEQITTSRPTTERESANKQTLYNLWRLETSN